MSIVPVVGNILHALLVQVAVGNAAESGAAEQGFENFLGLGVKDLKQLCKERRIDSSKCVQKEDLIALLRSAPKHKLEGTALSIPGVVSELALKQLKEKCAERQLDTSNCVEKEDLMALLESSLRTEQIPLPKEGMPPLLRSKHKVGNIPNMYLIENWISKEVEAETIAQLQKDICTKNYLNMHDSGGYRQTARFCLDTDDGGSALFEREEPPAWMNQLTEALMSTGAFPKCAPPNHILLNHYKPGDGIGAHQDGYDFYPVVGIVSLGSGAVFEFYKMKRDHTNQAVPEKETPDLTFVFPPRSLLLFEQDAYNNYVHQIQGRAYDKLEEGVVSNWEASNRAAWAADGWLVKQLEDKPGNATLHRKERWSLTIRNVKQENLWIGKTLDVLTNFQKRRDEGKGIPPELNEVAEEILDQHRQAQKGRPGDTGLEKAAEVLKNHCKKKQMAMKNAGSMLFAQISPGAISITSMTLLGLFSSGVGFGLRCFRCRVSTACAVPRPDINQPLCG